MTVKKVAKGATAQLQKPVPTQSKGKTKTVPAAVQKQDELKLSAQRYGKADVEMKALKETHPIFAEFEDAKRDILEKLDAAFAATENGKVAGSEYGTKFTVKKGSTSYKNKPHTMREIHEMIGDEAFYAIVNISITDLKNYLPAKKVEEMVVTEHTGARTVTGFKV